MSDVETTKTATINPSEHVRNDASKPMTPVQVQAMYAWSGDEEDCPENLFINATNDTPLVIAAQAQAPGDNGRIYPGDRVMGDYYATLLDLPMFTGLQRLKAVDPKRRLELERKRLERSGDLPQEWIIDTWSKLSADDRKKHEAEYSDIIRRAKEAKGE